MSQLPVAKGKAGSGIPKPSLSQIATATGSQLDLYAARNAQAATKPEAPETFVVGDRVWVGGTKLGTIRYIGDTKFAPGEWAGVELDESQGKNDGSVGGERYFQCPAMHGVFSRCNRLLRRQSVTSNYGAGYVPDTPGMRKVSTNLGSTRELRDSMSMSPTTSPTGSTVSLAGAPLKVGDRVIVASTMAGTKTGTLR